MLNASASKRSYRATRAPNPAESIAVQTRAIIVARHEGPFDFTLEVWASSEARSLLLRSSSWSSVLWSGANLQPFSDREPNITKKSLAEVDVEAESQQ